MSLFQDDDQMSGTFLADGGCPAALLKGTLDGHRMDLVLRDNDGYEATLEATVNEDEDRIQGEVTSAAFCDLILEGRWVVERQ